MRRQLLILLGAALLIAGCGGDDEAEAPTSASGAVFHYLERIQNGDVTGACAVITDEAQEAFAEALGETQASAGATCAETLGGGTIDSLAKFERGPDSLATEPGEEAGQTYVDAVLLSGSQTTKVRFAVAESIDGFKIVGAGGAL